MGRPRIHREPLTKEQADLAAQWWPLIHFAMNKWAKDCPHDDTLYDYLVDTLMRSARTWRADGGAKFNSYALRMMKSICGWFHGSKWAHRHTMGYELIGEDWNDPKVKNPADLAAADDLWEYANRKLSHKDALTLDLIYKRGLTVKGASRVIGLSHAGMQYRKEMMLHKLGA
jgi:DNA-directed RNA polymerase specialized sigma subunit